MSIVFLTGCISSDYAKEAMDYVPEPLHDGWEISTPEAEGLDPQVVLNVYQRFFSQDEYKTAQSLLLVRHGKLVAEGYARDRTDRDNLHNVKSVTKSIVSLALGIALDKGVFPNLDVTLGALMDSAHFPPDEPLKKQISLRNLVMMKSGLAYDENIHDDSVEIDDPSDSLLWHLSIPMRWAPGERFNYANSDPHLISGAIKAATGRSLDEFAGEFLFAPLGITNYRWERRRDGVSIGGYALHMLPRDMAKIGKLALNKGVWNGQQIVSQAWIDASTTAQTQTLDGAYGYFWWILPEFNAYMASGVGMQKIVVVPSVDMVIVLTGWPYTGDSDWRFEDDVYRIVSTAK